MSNEDSNLPDDLKDYVDRRLAEAKRRKAGLELVKVFERIRKEEEISPGAALLLIVGILMAVFAGIVILVVVIGYVRSLVAA